MTITDDNYFDHEADIGIIGRGQTIEKAFVNAAEALFAIMIDNLNAIQKKASVNIHFTESDSEIALVIWLNLLVGEARAHNLIFGHFTLTHKNNDWHGEAFGEPWHDQMIRGTEVKGATLTMLSVRVKNGIWEARCVVDV